MVIQRKQIFISYRRDGGDVFARLLYERLTAEGYCVFYDIESLRAGKFNIALYEKILECKDFLLILSPGCLDRCSSSKDWLRQEIELAQNCDRKIIPLIMHGFEFPAELPNSMKDLPKYNGIKVEMDDFNSVIAKLKNNFLSEIPYPKDDPAENQLEQSERPESKPDDAFIAPVNHYSQKTVAEMMKIASRDTRKYEITYRTALKAASGDAESQFRLGMLYGADYLMKNNYAKAVYWLFMATKGGNAKAMHYLGKCYYYGFGVKRNYAQALYWFFESAKTDENYQNVLCALGECHMKGKGVFRDMIRSAEYYHRAKEKGSLVGLARYIELLKRASKQEKELLKSYGYSLDTISRSQMREYLEYKKSITKRNGKIYMLFLVICGLIFSDLLAIEALFMSSASFPQIVWKVYTLGISVSLGILTAGGYWFYKKERIKQFTNEWK